MFTEEDMKTLKKIKNSYYDKKSEQSQASSVFDCKSEDQLYFSRYFLNSSFKILHIDIVGTQEVSASLTKFDSYMIYIINVMTEDYCYQVRRRYSEFLKLYESIMSYEALRDKTQRLTENQINKSTSPYKREYLFPTKKISSCLRNFFNITNKQKIAAERKQNLCTFLNQIKNNYARLPQYYTDHYIQMLKFIDMKQQHQKFWKQKQGKCLQLSNLALRDPTLIHQQHKNSESHHTINIEHLSQLLQHQINKINLVLVARNSYRQSSSMSQLGKIDYSTDPMITDQIIKHVDTIKDIVLEMKRRITYDHIRCIMKGKDVKEVKNNNVLATPAQTKKGLIQFSLKFTKNQLVIIHVIKTVLNVFLNSQCNYSSQAFLKIFAQLQLGALILDSDKEDLALSNKQFKESYFKLVRQYMLAKEQYGSDKKYQFQKFPATKLMGVILNNQFVKWLQKQEKNRSFKLKQQQKQWTMIIQNQGEGSPRNSSSDSFAHRSSKSQISNQSGSNRKSAGKENKDRNDAELLKFSLQNIEKETLLQTKKYKTNSIESSLKTLKSQFYSYFLLKAIIKDVDYKRCLELIKKQSNWNPLLIESQFDSYSNTKKQSYQIPGKQQKMFRFVEQQQIQINLQQPTQLQKDIDFENCEHFVPIYNDEEVNQQASEHKNPKMSTQTMPSVNGSCAHEHHPHFIFQTSEPIACSQHSHKTCFIKSPPSEGRFNSYTQKVKIQKLKSTKTSCNACLVEIQIYLNQESAMKFFNSQIQGSTSFIWEGFINFLTKMQEI